MYIPQAVYDTYTRLATNPKVSENYYRRYFLLGEEGKILAIITMWKRLKEVEGQIEKRYEGGIYVVQLGMSHPQKWGEEPLER